MDDLSEFLLIGAVLLEMKSHRLLPGRESGEIDEEFVGWEERDVLLARLLELRTYAALADAFVSLFERASRAYPRLRGVDDGFVVQPPDLLAGVTTAQLALAYLRGIEEKPVPVVRLHHVTVDAVTVAETVARAGPTPAHDGYASRFASSPRGSPRASRSSCTFSRFSSCASSDTSTLGQGATFGEVQIEWIDSNSRLDIGGVDSYEG